MNILRKIALPCGIIGGVWTILLSVFVFLFTPTQLVVTVTAQGEIGQLSTIVSEEVIASGNLAFLILTGFTAMMGILGLVAILSLKRRPQLRYVLMWVSAGAILAASLFLGVLLPAAILLVLATIGMREGSETPVG